MGSFYSTEQCFRRYEEFLIQAVHSFPTEIRVTDTTRAASTNQARCRDAISSWKAERWSSSVDYNTYARVIDQLRCWQYYGQVFVGAKSLAKLYLRTEKKNRQVSQVEVERIRLLTLRDLDKDIDGQVVKKLLEEQRKADALNEFRRVHIPEIHEPVKLKLFPKKLVTAPILHNPLEPEPVVELTLEEIVELIDSGESTKHFFVANTPHNWEKLTQLTEGRLNVAFTLDQTTNQIRIL